MDAVWNGESKRLGRGLTVFRLCTLWRFGAQFASKHANAAIIGHTRRGRPMMARMPCWPINRSIRAAYPVVHRAFSSAWMRGYYSVAWLRDELPSYP